MRGVNVPLPYWVLLLAVLCGAALAVTAQSSTGAVLPVDAINRALGKTASQQSTGTWCNNNRACEARFAVDGNVMQLPNNNPGCTHTTVANQWWRVDMEAPYQITTIVLYLRSDGFNDRLPGLTVSLSNSATAPDPAGVPVWSYTSATANSVYYITVPASVPASRYIEVTNANSFVTICELQAFDAPMNLALGKPTSQQATGNWCGGASLPCVASYGVDGVLSQSVSNGLCAHSGGDGQWWRVDLGSLSSITSIVYYARADSCCTGPNTGVVVYLSNSATAGNEMAQQVFVTPDTSSNWVFTITPPADKNIARYVEIKSRSNAVLVVCEVQVYGTANATTSACTDTSCNGHGTCLPGFSVGAVSCVCATGWTGATCLQPFDPCFNVTCGTTATPVSSVCIASGQTYRCSCRNGWRTATGSTLCTVPPPTPIACPGNFSLFERSDFNGNDLDFVGGLPSREDCLNFCQATPLCYAYHYKTNGNCWAKGAVALSKGPTSSNDGLAGGCLLVPQNPCLGVDCQFGGTCNGGLCHCVNGHSGTFCQIAPPTQFCPSFLNYTNYDTAQNQGTNVQTIYGVLQLSDCVNDCQMRSDCFGYVYNQGGTVCYLKDRTAASSNRVTATGTELGVCTDLCIGVACLNTGVCGYGTCHCRNGYTGDRCQTSPPPVISCTAGFRRHEEKDFYGSDLVTFQNVKTFEDCSNYCLSVPKCYAFTYDPAGPCYTKGYAAVVGGPITTAGRLAGECLNAPLNPCEGIVCNNGGSCLYGVCHCTGGFTGTSCDTRPAQPPLCTDFIVYDDATFSVGATVVTQHGVTMAADCANWCMNTANCLGWSWNGQICLTRDQASVLGARTVTANNKVGVCRNLCTGVNCGTHGECDQGLCHCNGGYSGSGCTVPPPPNCPKCTGAFTELTDRDFYGADLISTQVDVTQFRDCINFCRRVPNCYGVHWVPGTPATCYAKGAAIYLAEPLVSSGSMAASCAQRPTNPCETVTCYNGGTCDTGMCHCIGGYTGTNCQTAPDRAPACTSFVQTANSEFTVTANPIRTEYGITRYSDCLNLCEASNDCWAFTWTGQVCYTRNRRSLGSIVQSAGNTVGVCTVDPCTTMTGTNACQNGGVCTLGVCHCRGGYTGATCTTLPPNPVACAAFTRYDGADYYGYDLTSATGITTYEDCLNYCQSVPRCYSFGWDMSNQCWAKTVAGLIAGTTESTNHVAGGCTTRPANPCEGVTCNNGGSCDGGMCHCVGGYTGTDCGTAPAANAPACRTFTMFEYSDITAIGTQNTFHGITTYADCLNLCESVAGCWAFVWTGQQCWTKPVAALTLRATSTNNYRVGLCSEDACRAVTCQNRGVCTAGVCHCKGGYTGDRCQTAPPPNTPYCRNFSAPLQNSDYYGSDLGSVNGIFTFDDCLNYCQSVPRCYVFMWRESGNTCYTKAYAAFVKGPGTSNGDVAAYCTHAPPEDPCTGIVCQRGGTCLQGLCHCMNGNTGDRCQTPPPNPPACSNITRYENTDFTNGPTLSTNYGVTMYGDCLNMCQALSTCWAFTWTGQICYLKTAQALALPASTQGMTGGACSNGNPCLGVGCNYGTCSLGACRCQPGYGPMGTGTGRCNTLARGFCANFTKYAATDFTGNDLTSETTTSLDDCILACQGTANCRVVSYIGNTCYKKTGVAFATKTSQANSQGAACSTLADLCANVQCKENARCSLGQCVCTNGYSGAPQCLTPPPFGYCSGQFTVTNNTDMPLATLSTDTGVVDMQQCTSNCQTRATCRAVTYDYNGRCTYHALPALALRVPVANGMGSAVCNNALNENVTKCATLNCQNGGSCWMGLCQCANGWSGSTCTVSPLPARCMQFVTKADKSITGVTQLGSYDASSLAACTSRCQATPNCKMVAFRDYTCRVYAAATTATVITTPGSTVSACSDVFALGGRARFSSKFTTTKAVFETQIQGQLTAPLINCGPTVVSYKYAYAGVEGNWTAVVELGCLQDDCAANFALLKTAVASNSLGGIAVSNFELWCSEWTVPAFAPSCTTQPPVTGGKARFSARFVTGQDAFQTQIEGQLSAAAVNCGPTVATYRYTYSGLAGNQTAVVEVLCTVKDCKANFASLKTVVATGYMGGIPVFGYEAWCANWQTPAYAADCDPKNDPAGSSSSDSISGGAVAGIVIGIIVAAALGTAAFLYFRSSGGDTSKKTKLRPHRASGSSYSGTASGTPNVELNTVSGTPVGNTSGTPGLSAYTIAPPMDQPTHAPPLPPMPRM